MHVPVLFDETLEFLITDPQGVYIDCTVGGGGHFQGILERTGDRAILIGIDQDADALERARSRVGTEANRILVKGNFRNLRTILEGISIKSADGILIDLGVSSYQLDEEERGFSYHLEARLDMRMDPELNSSAWDVVNKWPADKLEQIIGKYGEERYAGRIARGIVNARQYRSIDSTLDLVEVIRRSVPASYKRETHPARRTFQALRIEVNQEIESLRQVLPQATAVLKPGGRICVISFHSLEDRMVKDYFTRESKDCLCPSRQPVCTCGHKAQLKVLTRKPVVASPGEIARNNRARSAKLRVAQKLEF
ncbi:MAG: 16S rRNA (cytosine(1402)-N(4))-methyltransferase RsmH [Bacillota bacterium]